MELTGQAMTPEGQKLLDSIRPGMSFSRSIEENTPFYLGFIRNPEDRSQEEEDQEYLAKGILDPRSYNEARTLKANPIQYVHTDWNGNIKSIRYTHNLRTNLGATWMGWLMAGGAPAAGTPQGYGMHTAFVAASVSGNIVTGPAGFAPAAGQYIGHWLTMGATYGQIVAHTTGASATATVDRWYDTAVTTGAATTTPTAGQVIITAGQGIGRWIALTNDATTPNTSTPTTLTSEIAANGLSRAFGALAFVPPSASQGTTVQGTLTLSNTFTCNTGAQSAQQSAIFNSATSANGIMLYWATFTTVSLQIADSVAITWTENF